MTSGIHNCPDWDQDIPSGRQSEFATELKDVVAHICQNAQRRLLNQEDVRRIHRKLFRNFVPLFYYAGYFRQPFNAGRLFCLDVLVAVDGIAGTEQRLVATEMAALCDEVASATCALELDWDQMSDSERAHAVAKTTAFLVGDFIRIHPFLNGNGRVSRLLWLWGLQRFRTPPQVRISPRPMGIYPDVMAACMRGDYAPLGLEILRWLTNNPPTV